MRSDGIHSPITRLDRCAHRALDLRRSSALVLAGWILLVVFAAPLAGEDWEIYRGWTVSSFDITGLDGDTASKLKSGLAVAATSGLLGTERAPFQPENLSEDLRRTTLFLARRGYPYARLHPRAKAVAKRRRIALVLHIDPGPPVLVTGVALDSLPATLSEKTMREVTLAPGKALADVELEASMTKVQAKLVDQGHARATVTPRLDWRDSTHVDVHFVIQPGPVYYFGDLILPDVRPDLEGLARETIGIRRGDIYSPNDLSKGRNNLRTLGLFLQTRLEIVDAAYDTVDVVATLVERRPSTIETSLRYWTDESLQGTARWTNRNIFGGGRGLSAGITASSLLQKTEVATWWPAIAGPNTFLIPTLRAEREDEESYTTVSAGGLLSLRYNFSFETHLLAGIDVSHVNVTEKLSGSLIQAQDGLLTALRFEGSRRRTDDPIMATRGNILGAGLEWAPKDLGTDNSYATTTLGAAYFVPILPRTQIALRALVGAATPTAESVDLLPNKRFYSGGASSHRGFHRRKLGPLDEGGAPIGGEAKIETSLELRFPIAWRLRGTAFVDAGQVWRTLDDVAGRDVEVAVGPGVWLTTPIGPIRADVGYRLTFHETSQPRWVFHFTAGPAF